MKNPLKDNLFDSRITPLDVVKILLLVVTLFSTWYVVDVMTPDVPLAWIRIIAAVGVVEGAFLGFEAATSKARSIKQAQLATIGFFCSLFVIAVFFAVAGFLEFAGSEILTQSLGVWMGIAWNVHDAVALFALIVTVSWIAGLASIYRLYSIADPDKIAELTETKFKSEVDEEANTALRDALTKSKPILAITRTLVKLQEDFGAELPQSEMDALKSNVQGMLEEKYGVKLNATHPQRPALPTAAMRTPQTELARTLRSGPSPDVEPIDPDFDENAPIPAPRVFSPPANKIANDANNGKGNGHGNFTQRREPPLYHSISLPRKVRKISKNNRSEE